MNDTTERPPDAQAQLELYSTDRAGEILEVSGMTVRRMIYTGELRGVDISPEGSARPRYRVRSDDLAAYIESRTGRAGAA